MSGHDHPVSTLALRADRRFVGCFDVTIGDICTSPPGQELQPGGYVPASWCLTWRLRRRFSPALPVTASHSTFAGALDGSWPAAIECCVPGENYRGLLAPRSTLSSLPQNETIRHGLVGPRASPELQQALDRHTGRAAGVVAWRRRFGRAERRLAAQSGSAGTAPDRPVLRASTDRRRVPRGPP